MYQLQIVELSKRTFLRQIILVTEGAATRVPHMMKICLRIYSSMRGNDSAILSVGG